MALPKINESPKYEMIIPSSKRSVRFRPFLVKEEKVLMMAMESNDTSQMLGSIVDTLDACVDDDLDKNSLTTFDVEYMFTKLRAKSVGETSTIGINCSECETQNEVSINVDTISVDVPDVDKIIDLGGNIRVEMRWPSYGDIIKMNPDQENTTSQVFAILRSSLAAVHTEDERIDLRDESEEEIQNFIESMNREQFAKIQSFVEQMPTLTHSVNFKCSECDHDNETILQGMQSFF